MNIGGICQSIQWLLSKSCSVQKNFDSTSLVKKCLGWHRKLYWYQNMHNHMDQEQPLLRFVEFVIIRFFFSILVLKLGEFI